MPDEETSSGVSSELLDYIERAGARNMEFHYENINSLLNESNRLLLLLLTAAIAALGFGVARIEGGVIDPLVAGALTVSVYLFFVCGLLTLKCIMAATLEPPSNTPVNLLEQRSFDFDLIREAELENLDARIAGVVARNDRVACWLNAMRIAAVLTPIPFVLAVAVSAFVGDPVAGLLCGQGQAAES